MSEIRTSVDFGRSTLVPFPDTVQQTEHSKSERFRSDFGHLAFRQIIGQILGQKVRSFKNFVL